MNPLSTINLPVTGNSIENNALSTPVGAVDGLSSELFAGEFSLAMENVLSVDGKLKPLDLATLKELGIQQLTNLQELDGIELPSQSIELSPQSLDIELKPQSVLSMLSSEDTTQIENIDLFGNPDANALLKTTDLINNDSLEEGILNKSVNKPDVLVGRSITADAIQQSIHKKDADSSNILDDINFSQHMKELGKSNIDADSELLSQVSRQEVNTTKLVDQLTSVDKPLNAIATANNNSIKTYSNAEQAGAMIHRIEVPVTQAGWGEAVGNRLMMMVNGKMQSANIHLNPAELGPIEIRVKVNQDQATVHFVSSNSVVREAIEEAFPRLKEMFMQNGITLTDANVSQQSSQHSRQYSSEQNNSQAVLDEDSIEATDVQIEHINDNMLDIGFVNHYV